MAKDHRVHFNSWGEFVNQAVNGESSMKESERSSRKSDNYSYNAAWSGTDTFPEAVTEARKGYPAVSEKINKLSASMFEKLSKYCMKPDPAYVTEGSILDVGRWVSGEPEHWLIMDEAESLISGKRVARITYNIAASAAVERKVLEAKGAAIVTLVKLLDYSGIRTELELVMRTTGGYGETSQHGTYAIAVKTASQDLDLDLVSFAIGHVASFRRLGFSVMETFPPDIRANVGIPGGYGVPTDLEASEYSSSDLYIPKAHVYETQWSTPEAAEAWILESLVKCGATLKELPQ